MYAKNEIQKGMKNPSLIYEELSRQYKIHRPHDIGVHGSYRTGNIGDRALGELFQRELEKSGYQTYIFDKQTEKSNAKIRILGGGGVLHDFYGTSHLKKRLNYVSENGMIVGVGVPGFRSEEARELIAEYLPKMELITVRDKKSKNTLDDLCDANVVHTACPVFIYDDPNVTTGNKTGVNFKPWFNKSSSILSYYFGYEEDLDLQKSKEIYIENMKSICNRVNNPIFIPFHEDDEEFAKKYLDIEILPYSNSVETTLRRVSGIERMVTTRYHSLIFSLICQKPVLPIAYAPKVSLLAERLGISSHLPHEEIPLHFEEVSDLEDINEQAKRNFELVLGSINIDN